VNPNGGDQHDFPVEVLGTNFPDMNNITVMFGKTMMPVLSVRPDGTGVSVGYPANGLPTPGGLDVMVRNGSDGDSNPNNDPQDVMLNGFMFENDATRPAKTSLFGCGPASTSGGAGGDMLVLLGVVALLLAAWYRRGAQV
jgi:hypothetical protein